VFYDFRTSSKQPDSQFNAHQQGMTSLQVPATTAVESQQNNTQFDDEFEQIEAPVTFKV
jgi:hypothetical protein